MIFPSVGNSANSGDINAEIPFYKTFVVYCIVSRQDKAIGIERSVVLL